MVIWIIISLIISPWFKTYHLPQNAFNLDIKNDIRQARANVDWKRGKVKPSAINSIFLNWPAELFSERVGVVMENLDIGNYFFSGHPRERVDVLEKQKFLAIQFVFFVIGLTSKRLNQYKKSLFIYMALVLLLVFIFKWRTFEETILLSVPIVVVSAFGMEKIYSLTKRCLVTKRVIL